MPAVDPGCRAHADTSGSAAAETNAAIASRRLIVSSGMVASFVEAEKYRRWLCSGTRTKSDICRDLVFRVVRHSASPGRRVTSGSPVPNAYTVVSMSRLSAVLSDPERTPLLVGRETATELGIDALEHLEGTPSDEDLRALVIYAARHDEASPARDALVGVLLNASDTLPAPVAQRARAEIMRADWGSGRETAGLQRDPDVRAVPRRQALAERLLAERARRLRPQMHAVVTDILARSANAGAVPSWFLERNWVDLRETLVQRIRSDPVHREAITGWFRAQHPAIRTWLQPIEDALIDVATQSILDTPQRAPLAPYCGENRVADRVRTAVTFRGEPARARLSAYLARLTPGTEWYETIRSIMDRPSETRRA